MTSFSKRLGRVVLISLVLRVPSLLGDSVYTLCTVTVLPILNKYLAWNVAFVGGSGSSMRAQGPCMPTSRTTRGGGDVAEGHLAGTVPHPLWADSACAHAAIM